MKTEYDAFAATYDLEYGTFEEDLDFYVELAKEAEPPVLELATGTGRVSLRIAREGVPIVGIDTSAEMLAAARKKLEGEPALPLRLVEADMRDFELEEVKGRLELVIIPARAFLHLTTTADQIACLTNVRDHLREGGLLALNFFVPDVELIAAHRGRLGRVVTFQSRFAVPDSGNEIEVWGHRRYRVHDQFIEQRFVYHEWDAEGRLVRITRQGYTLCYIWPREFEHLLVRCGFEVEGLYGWFDKRPFDEKSPEQVWVARRG